MQRLQIVFDVLQQFKPGEIEQEPPSVQQSFSTEVHTCVYTYMYMCIYVYVHV